MKRPRPVSRVRRTALFPLWLLWVGVVLAGPLRAQDDGDPAEDPLASARAALQAGNAAASVLAVHASELAQAGELETLGRHLLEGGTPVVTAVLGALEAHRVVGLVPELVGVAASADDADLRRQAFGHLERLCLDEARVREDLMALLADPEQDQSARRQAVRLLGRSRDLGVVASLLAELGGPIGTAASDALSRLSGHAVPSGDDPSVFWPTFWEAHGDRPRDVLLDEALAVERLRRSQDLENAWGELQRLREDLIQLRLQYMDDNVERLIAGLTDEFAAVRLEAARRLASHAAHEQAQAALPVLLERMAMRREGSNGSARQVPIESSVDVRAAVVAALGVLGRDRPEVLDVLIAQVQADDPVIAAVAVDALVHVRDMPAIVEPLIVGLRGGSQGLAPDDETTVKLLRIVAANQPSGVLVDLRPFLMESRPEEVRRSAVRAVLACAELGDALQEVMRMESSARSLLVRFSLASSLGDRVHGLPAEAPEREPILELLAELLEDVEASVRAEAASSLGESSDPRALALLQDRARREIDASVLIDLVEALGELGDPQAVATIGRVAASSAVDGGSRLAERAQRAVASIGADAPPSAWLDMAETLAGVGAHGLALFATNEVLYPTREGVAADTSVADRARGRQARSLAAMGRHADAVALLEQIHEEGGAEPPAGEREELLAASNAALGRHDAAADWWGVRLSLLDETDPRFVAVRRELALALMRTDRHEETLVHLVALAEAAPDDNDLMLAIGKVRMAKGEDERAHEVLSRLVGRLPDPSDPLRLEAEGLLSQLDPGPAPATDGAEADDGDDGTTPPSEPPSEPELDDGGESGTDSDQVGRP